MGLGWMGIGIGVGTGIRLEGGWLLSAVLFFWSFLSLWSAWVMALDTIGLLIPIPMVVSDSVQA